MIRHGLLILSALLFLALPGGYAAGQASAAGPTKVPYADCDAVAKNILTIQDVNRANAQLHDAASAAVCVASYLPPHHIDGGILRALLNGSNHRQQSSPSGSSSATSPVSKPSGSNAVIQDFGGLSASSGGSSFTAQFSPSELMEELGTAGDIQYCTAALHPAQCISKGELGLATRTTLSATINTSTSGQQVTGTAGSSAGKSAPAALSILDGNSRPTFGGATAKYVLLYTKQNGLKPAKDDSTVSSAAQLSADAIGTLNSLLGNCGAYQTWTKNDLLTADNRSGSSVAKKIQESYKTLATNMVSDSTCEAAKEQIYKVVMQTSDYQQALALYNYANAGTPLLGAEYDFTTPVNKPSYHSAKMNFSWQSKTGSKQQVKQQTFVQKKLPQQANTGGPAGTGQRDATAAAATSGADSSVAPSPAWTVNATFSADLYASDQSNTVPTAEELRDVQLAGEVTRVFATSGWGKVGTLWRTLATRIGDTSLVGAFLYEDQTSPGILNGPPSTVTFNGLPTTASQVYAKRGPIDLGQVRLGFGTGKSVRFPLAFTYSNRSELIVHPTWGVQFGLSYDLSSFLGSGSSKASAN